MRAFGEEEFEFGEEGLVFDLLDFVVWDSRDCEAGLGEAGVSAAAVDFFVGGARWLGRSEFLKNDFCYFKKIRYYEKNIFI